MRNNKLIVAAAGSGKTTFLVDQACELTKASILITTYTETNALEIRQKIIAKKGYLPSNITIQPWFSFLLQHGVRPYQSSLNGEIHQARVGFFLSESKSGQKYNQVGKPLVFKGRPIYWGEKDFKKYYFTKGLQIFSDKISKFIVASDKKEKGEIFNRISRIYTHIFIDEIQDLAGHDLEIIKLLFKSTISVLLVGDPRQVTYLTNNSTKYKKYFSTGQ